MMEMELIGLRRYTHAFSS